MRVSAFLAVLLLSTVAHAGAPWPKLTGVELCGLVEIPQSGPGGAVHELSGLAGDANRIFSVSDQGWLVTIAPRFEGGVLKSATPTRVVELSDVDGKALPWAERDAEGLALVQVSAATQDSERVDELWVSFERTPRIERFSLDGRRRGVVALSKSVTAPSNFASPNQAFEALAVVRGKPLTAPERPAAKDAGSVPLLGPDGKVARFVLSEGHNASLVGLDVVRGNTLVALERSFKRKNRRTVITLSKFTLPKKRGRKVMKVPLAVLDSERGFEGIDNFEGVLSLGDGRVLLISDDNESDVQRQLLLCLDIARLK